MVKKIFVTISLLFIITSLYASSTEDIRKVLPGLAVSERESLLRGEIVSSTTIGGNAIAHLYPKDSYGQQDAIKAETATNSFSITALSFIPYGPKLQAMDKEARQLKIFNTLRAISTQEGITYISHRAGNQPRELIEKSRYIEDPKKRSSDLPDPVATTFPLKAESYVYQKDSTFSGNIYEHIYTNSLDEIYVSIKNLDSMKAYGLVTAVKKEKLSISLGTYQLEEGLLMYGLTTIEDKEPQINVLWYSVDLPSSFKRRITSLMEWFVASLEKIEKE